MSSEESGVELGRVLTLRMALEGMLARAGELSDMPLKQLRSLHPDNVTGSSTFKASRGDCVESILYEEFQELIETP